MQIQLSQKERMLLEDEKNQEEVCIIKYKITPSRRRTSIESTLQHIIYGRTASFGYAEPNASGAATQYGLPPAGSKTADSSRRYG